MLYIIKKEGTEVSLTKVIFIASFLLSVYSFQRAKGTKRYQGTVSNNSVCILIIQS